MVGVLSKMLLANLTGYITMGRPSPFVYVTAPSEDSVPFGTNDGGKEAICETLKINCGVYF